MRVPAKIKAGTENMSRSKRYKVIQFRLGNCINCGSPRKGSSYLRHCETCGDGRKKKRRKKLGSRPWKIGKPGRPPLKAARKQEEVCSENLTKFQRKPLILS